MRSVNEIEDDLDQVDFYSELHDDLMNELMGVYEAEGYPKNDYVRELGKFIFEHD